MPCKNIFLRKFEKEFITILPVTPHDYNLSNEGWLEMRGLADHNIVIKPASYQGFCIVICDREDYFKEAHR